MSSHCITFDGCTSVGDLSGFTWEQEQSMYVEFFTDQFYKVTYISSSSPNLNKALSLLDNSGPVCLDLEWKPDIDQIFHEVSIIQLSTGFETLVIKNILGTASEEILNFLNTHKLVGKGTSIDRIKLESKFGSKLSIDLEDVELTRLKPRGLSINFNEMVLQWAGVPKVPFKDKSITLSNWESPQLTTPQILYAAFDVVALTRVASNLKPYIYQKKTNGSNTNHTNIMSRITKASRSPLKITFKNSHNM